MNEQMQKLELEAIAYADSKVPANNRYNDIYHRIVRGKFAELIVRECARSVSWYTKQELAGVNRGQVFRANKTVLEHFGVEE